MLRMLNTDIGRGSARSIFTPTEPLFHYNLTAVLAILEWANPDQGYHHYSLYWHCSIRHLVFRHRAQCFFIARIVFLAVERVSNIFERGSQVFPVVGLRLGLYLCHTYIEQHGGLVGVESQADHRATFWFSLPCSDAVDRAYEAIRKHAEADVAV